jgi:hypothetical protein
MSSRRIARTTWRVAILMRRLWKDEGERSKEDEVISRQSSAISLAHSLTTDN